MGKNILIITCCLVFVFALPFLYSCRKEKSCNNCPTPSSTNKPPVARAGIDTTIRLPQDSLELNGSGSFDPDGNIRVYGWRKLSGPASYTIMQPQAARTMIKDLVAGSHFFELRVTDDKGSYSQDTIRVSVVDHVGNRPPIANAGADRIIVLPNDEVTLDGVNSTDPDNNIVSYHWAAIAGPATTLVPFPNQVTTLASPLVLGIYQFELTVTDAGGLLSKDTMQVTVKEPVPVVCGNNRPQVSVNMIAAGFISKPRSGMAVAAAGNKIVFAGGYTSTEPGMTRVDIYDISTSSWSTAELSSPRHGMSAIAAGNKIFFAGGVLGDLGDVQAYSDRVDIYDVVTNTWSVTSLSQPVLRPVAAATGTKVLFAGGWVTHTIGNTTYYGYHRSTVDIYNIANGSWSTAQLTEPRADMSAVTIDDKVFFAGGVGGPYGYSTDLSDKVQVYDGETNSWSGATLSQAKTGMVGIAYGNKIYWGAGYNYQGGLCEVEIRDANTLGLTLNYLAAPETEVAVIKNNRIVFYSGRERLDIFDPVTGNWSVGDMPFSRIGAAVIAVNNVMYVAGGYLNSSGNAYSNEVWKLEF